MGDFYLGYRKYAMLEIVGATLLWALFLSTVVPAIIRRGPEGALVAGPIFALIAFIHIGDSLLTRAKAQTGLHSKDGNLPTDVRRGPFLQDDGGSLSRPTAPTRLDSARENTDAVDAELLGGAQRRVLRELVAVVGAGLFDLEASLFDQAKVALCLLGASNALGP